MWWESRVLNPFVYVCFVIVGNGFFLPVRTYKPKPINKKLLFVRHIDPFFYFIKRKSVPKLPIIRQYSKVCFKKWEDPQNSQFDATTF